MVKECKKLVILMNPVILELLQRHLFARSHGVGTEGAGGVYMISR
jgi:hypothetical protein